MGKKSFSAGHLGRNHSERKEIIRTRVRSGTLGSDYIGLAPQVGLEPTTTRLTAECSAIELLRNMESGSDLSSRAVSSQVLSALKGLTAVFGMGTGGTPSSLPPEMVSYSLRRSLSLPDCRIVAPFRFPVKPSLSLRLPVPLVLSRTLTTAHRMIHFRPFSN